MYQEPSPKMLPPWVSPSLSGVFLGFFVFSFPAPAFDSHQHPRSRSNSKRGAEEAASCGPQLLALAEGGVCSLLQPESLSTAGEGGAEPPWSCAGWIHPTWSPQSQCWCLVPGTQCLVPVRKGQVHVHQSPPCLQPPSPCPHV